MALKNSAQISFTLPPISSKDIGETSLMAFLQRKASLTHEQRLPRYIGLNLE
jgi:hypothetical protein